MFPSIFKFADSNKLTQILSLLVFTNLNDFITDWKAKALGKNHYFC